MKVTNSAKYFFIGLLFFIANHSYSQYQSSILHYNENNRIMDFSYAGYKNGEVELPVLPVVLEIDPISGDNTSHILIR